MDCINIEILEDGTITVKTSEISNGNHMSADDLMVEIDRLMGGKVNIAPNEDAKRKAHAHAHQHHVAHHHH